MAVGISWFHPLLRRGWGTGDCFAQCILRKVVAAQQIAPCGAGPSASFRYAQDDKTEEIPQIQE
jgi:hypothetical protein